ncbi:amino acid aminotransferase [uncultured Gilvimarinus sp.]|uniref:amino acid aminotransferase n=1 Tax=uncultured Gilvimarinus sp. TaxID=1689143 RepID=UPI0030D75F86
MLTELPLLPADPILGLSAAYHADTNPDKVDLGVGVYKTEQGNTPILACVKQAEAELYQNESSKVYTPPAGVPGANRAAAALAFGEQHAVVRDQRVATIQTPGGCGALRAAAELIAKAKPNATIWVSNPTWGNHVPLLSSAGITLKEYPYYDFNRQAIDFDAMLEALQQAGKDDLVLLHACCHNPSGADLTPNQWQQITELAAERGFTPFIDMAYQGFGDGIVEDAYGVRLMADQLPELILATSFSKNLGLYRERTGSLSIVAPSATGAAASLSQILSITRGLYSMPPAHGSSLVDIIYHSESLHALWLQELTDMRERISGLREQLVGALNSTQQQMDFSFIAQQRGMFSFLGLSTAQVTRLKNEFSVYMTDNSRVNIAGVNSANLDYVSRSIGQVLS